MIRALILFLAIACPGAANAQSFVSIFTQLPDDFAHLTDRTNLGVLGGTGLGSLVLYPKDRAIAERANDADDFFMAGHVLGEGTTHAAAGLAIYVVGRVKHDTKWGSLGHQLLRAQLVSGIITDGLKLATNRTRPNGTSDYSFPSGHTSSAFASAAVLHSRFGWKVGVPSYVIAAYVGSSRMAQYHHFATDVLFGAGVGIAAGRATTFHHRNTTLNVVPAVTRNSATINVAVVRHDR